MYLLRLLRSLTQAHFALVVGFSVLLLSSSAQASDFYADLKRVDEALRTNPGQSIDHAIDSCRTRRNSAVALYEMGHVARAERRLQQCFVSLKIPTEAPKAASPPEPEDLRAKAAKEIERALTLEPNVRNGLEIYRECAACHQPEGWGYTGGMVPQIAGQHREVIIKQLADIRAGYRENPLMEPYASAESIGGAQAIADVAEYIDTLEISIENGKGHGDALALGKQLYVDHCARCHGAQAEGNGEKYIPRLQSQHYAYLLRQIERMLEGKRKNADPEMMAQIKGFERGQIEAVVDYVSRLTPPVEFQAPPGWRNPDFAP